MPMLFDNAQQGMRIVQGELGREMLAGLKRNRLHGLGIWHDGPGYVFVRGKPVEKPADLAGKKIRIFPSAPLEAGIRAANGIPVSLPAPDVYVAAARTDRGRGVGHHVRRAQPLVRGGQGRDPHDAVRRRLWRGGQRPPLGSRSARNTARCSRKPCA